MRAAIEVLRCPPESGHMLLQRPPAATDRTKWVIAGPSDGPVWLFYVVVEVRPALAETQDRLKASDQGTRRASHYPFRRRGVSSQGHIEASRRADCASAECDHGELLLQLAVACSEAECSRWPNPAKQARQLN